MKIVGIVQARMGSTRLPGKMMMPILGRPVVQYVFDRVRPSQLINEVWLATTVDQSDDVLANWALASGVTTYRGSVDNVLDRYYQAAKLAQADAVVRVTGDCPLTDYEIIDKVVHEYVAADRAYDYVCNTQPPTYPDGLDTEVFSFAALEKAWREARLQSEREHVTPFIWKHPEFFKIKNVVNDIDLSALRWTLDTPEDFELIRRVIEEMNKQAGYAHLAQVLKIFQSHPEWKDINAHYERNEGYAKSLREDEPAQLP